MPGQITAGNQRIENHYNEPKRTPLAVHIPHFGTIGFTKCQAELTLFAGSATAREEAIFSRREANPRRWSSIANECGANAAVLPSRAFGQSGTSGCQWMTGGTG
jgi:hypothetical protein